MRDEYPRMADYVDSLWKEDNMQISYTIACEGDSTMVTIEKYLGT